MSRFRNDACIAPGRSCTKMPLCDFVSLRSPFFFVELLHATTTHGHDDDDDYFKIESAHPVSDTFCEPVPEISRKLQLEHHQCIRFLKAVYGLVNAPRRWYHRVATDLRNLTGEESVMEPCSLTFRDENGVQWLSIWKACL